MVVEIERQGRIALVAFNNPPVNAASQALRQGLLEAAEALDADPCVGVIVLYGKGRTFIAGADIKEFGKPLTEPFLPAVINRLEACETPIVSVLHGTALGGGLETALGTHARVALPSARIGLPEVHIGIFPGAGGTQRVPRLAGIPFAIDMCTSGRMVGAAEALEHGLIDGIEEGDPREVALRTGQAVLDGDLATRRTGELSTVANDAAIKESGARMAARFPHLISPQKSIEAIAASLLPIHEGLEIERKLFFECLNSPQREGLVHAFFAERAVSKIPEANAHPREIASIGVIGGGTMGSGIATAALFAGLPVTLIERDDAAAAKTRATIEANVEGAVARGKLPAEKREAILGGLLTLGTDFDAIAQADLIIEAVFEDMDVKKEVFAKLDAVAKPGAILASNTSFLDIDEIAASTSRPADVLGLHFFSPAHIMRLLEVVVGRDTAPEVTATGFALAKKLRKIAVRAGVCDGFIGNRILNHYRKVADYMVMDGASPYQVDAALEAFGFAMGPFAVSDLAGLDISWATRKRQAATRPAEEREVVIGDRICERGWFGRKTGRGYYLYDGKTRVEDPEVLEIIAAERQAAGIVPRGFTDQEIVDRYMTAMISEAARVVEDGIALRPIDVDAVYLFGYGFPRFRGGPLHYADAIGAQALVDRIETWADEDAFYWKVPKLLAQMAKNGSTFSELNEEG